MSLKPVVESKEGLDEGIANLYVEKEGGGFILDVDNSGPLKLEDVSGLLKTRDDWKAKATKKGDSLSAFGDHTPESIAEMMTRLESSGSNEEFQTQLTGLKSQHAEQLTSKDTELQNLMNQMNQMKQNNAINGVYSSHASIFKEGTSGAVKNIIGKYVGADDNGNPFIKDLASGSARMSNIAGQYEAQMTEAEFFEGIKGAITSKGSFAGVDAADIQVLSYLMSSSASGGSGAGTPHSSGNMTKEQFNELNMTEKTELFKTNPALARQLMG